MAIVLEVTSAQGDVSQQRLQPGRNRITVRPGDAYRVIDEATQHTPPGVVVKRVDNNIVIDGLGTAPGADAPTVVELVDYYGICSAGSPCDIVIDEAGQTPTVISPISTAIGALADGSYVLYDRGYIAPAPVATGDDGGGLSRPMMYGLAGVGILGLAAAGGGGGGGGGSAVGSDSATGDGTLRLTSAASTNSHTPTLTGTGTPGSTVVVRFDTNHDGISELRYDVVVGADGQWNLNLATATPVSGSLPAGGLPESVPVQISQGPVNLPIFNLVYDDIPPAPARVDPVTVDGVVSGAEKAAGIQVTGSAEPGGTVVVTWGNIQKVAAVDASGRWAVGFTPAEIPGNGSSQISVVSRDAAGNVAPATVTPVQVNTDGPNLSVTQVGTGTDTVINAAEAAGGVTIRGTADPNATIQVVWNGVTMPAIANAAGDWAVTIPAAQVPNPTGADGQTYPLVVNATSTVGNTATREVPVRVDRTAPGAPAIGAVEGDDRVSTAERADGVRVSGTAEAGAQIVVTWGDTTLRTEAGANGQWSVNFAAAQVPAATGTAATVPITAQATDAAGNVGAAGSRPVVIEPPFTAPTINPVEGDDRVSAAERADGVVLSGTVQAGAPGVTVTWGGFTQTVQPTGTTWQVTVPAAQVPADGSVPVTAAIAGAGGASASRPVTIDTTPPPPPTINPVEGDNRVTVAEAANGVPISGTAEAGARVEVVWGGATQTATAGADGRWTVNFATAPAVAAGGAATEVSVTATDAVGNRGTATTLPVFVEAAAFPAPTISPVTGDGIVNAAEASGNVVVTGTHPAGVTGVTVTVGGASIQATLGAGNSWQATIPAAQWTDGTVNVTATNAGAGGGASAAQAVTVDLTPPAVTVHPISTDNQVLVGETNVVVSGTASPDTVQVVVQNGTSPPVLAAVAANGNWSVTIPSLGAAPGAHALQVQATDDAGNTTTVTAPYSIVAPTPVPAPVPAPPTEATAPLTLDVLTVAGAAELADPTAVTLTSSTLLDQLSHQLQSPVGLG